MGLSIGEWEYLSFHSHLCILHLPRWVLIQKHYLRWSWRDQIIFLLICFLDAGQNCCRRKLCNPSHWYYWALVDWGLPSKTVVLQLLHSIWRILWQMTSKTVASIMKNLLEVSWITEWCCVHFIRGLYWVLKVTVLMCSNDAWLIQSKVSGVCPLICWCMLYVHASSKMKELMCINGYQWYTWWCVKQLLSFKASPSKLFRDVATGPNLSLTTDDMFLLCSLDFGCIQWSGCENCSRLNLLLLLTLCPCRFPFHTQVMILVRS